MDDMHMISQMGWRQVWEVKTKNVTVKAQAKDTVLPNHHMLKGFRTVKMFSN